MLIIFVLTSIQSKAQQTYDKVCGDYDYDDISIMNLIVTPEKYDGKIVQVTGVLSLEFESSGLYLSKEAFEYNLPNASVTIEFPERIIGNFQNLNGEYVILEGLFASNAEHDGVKFDYRINKICHIQVYPKLGFVGGIEPERKQN